MQSATIGRWWFCTNIEMSLMEFNIKTLSMKYFLVIIMFALSLLSSCFLNKKNRTKNANLVELGFIKIDYGLTSYFYPSEDKNSYVEYLKSQQPGYLQFLLDSYTSLSV